MTPEPPDSMPARVVRPDRVTDATAQAMEKELVDLEKKQLENVRKSAGAWQAGLATLTTVVTGALLIKGKESVDELDHTWAIIIACVLGLALLCLVLGLHRGLQASAGEPQRYSRKQIREMGGVPGLNLSLAETAMNNLKEARKLSYLGAALLATALAMTWFAPGPDKKKPPQIQVTSGGGAPVCGESAGIRDGALRVKTGGGNEQAFKLDTITAMSVVAKCP